MGIIESFVNWSNDILWSYVLIIMLVGLGLWFTLRIKFAQLFMIGEMCRLLKEGTNKEGGQISSFQAFCISTASRVGVGNIAGIQSTGRGSIPWNHSQKRMPVR